TALDRLITTPAHCLACFEALDAHLDHRKPLSLSEVEASYALYQSSPPDESSAVGASKTSDPPRLAAADDTADSSSSSSPTTSPAWSSSTTPATSISSLSLGTSSAPLFVTWNTVGGENSGDDDDADNDDVSLRGCIGTFESQPLSLGIPEYALISALHDTRFAPISKREMPELQAAVTLLTDFEQADDAYDWDIGIHGIRLSFTDNGHRYGATYLPNVASEQGWSKDETLYSLIRKAGWMGGRTRWKALELKVTRYQGRKASLNYPEFKKWRDWLATRQS
ncbi:hypothetical protein E4U53_003173, partial [Claviceps sorghi]